MVESYLTEALGKQSFVEVANAATLKAVESVKQSLGSGLLMILQKGVKSNSKKREEDQDYFIVKTCNNESNNRAN